MPAAITALLWSAESACLVLTLMPYHAYRPILTFPRAVHLNTQPPVLAYLKEATACLVPVTATNAISMVLGTATLPSVY